MPKEKTDATEQAIEAEPTEEKVEAAEPAEPESRVYKQEEVDELIKAARDEEFNRANRKLSEMGAKIKTLESRAPVDEDDFSIQEATLKVLKNRQSEYGEPDPEIARLEAALASEKQKKQSQKKEREIQSRIDEQQKIVGSEREKIQQRITEAKLDPDDEQFDAMWDAFDYAADNTGNFEKANKRLERVLSKAKPQGKPEVNEEEEKRKKMEKEGWLQTDTNYPSKETKVYTREQIAKMSIEEFAKNKDDIDKARKAGNIK